MAVLVADNRKAPVRCGVLACASSAAGLAALEGAALPVDRQPSQKGEVLTVDAMCPYNFVSLML